MLAEKADFRGENRGHGAIPLREFKLTVAMDATKDRFH
jgi:hypothetical protein